MPGPNSAVTSVDGSLDFSGGVDSLKVTTIQSSQNPNGLARNELAWLINATVRDGGISQRYGWNPIGTAHDGSVVFQGGDFYIPDSGSPYILALLSGNVWKIDALANPIATNLSAAFGVSLPASNPQAYFKQAEKFMVIQAGDGTTLPLFWDGVTLRKSKGITNTAVAPGTPGVNEIPAATTMDYYMGRLWYAQGRQYSAGDIVGGGSGTVANQFRDAVLNVTENPLVLGGDGFTVPNNAGTITALFHNANLNTALGQGQLLIGTRKCIYALQVPVTRTDWIAANNTNQPLQTVVQFVNGPVSDRSVVPVNGDVYYQSFDPAIRSLIAAIRYFGQPGNISISANEERLLQFTNRALLKFSTGIQFDNRLLQSGLPLQRPQGVVHQAIIPLDFLPMSTPDQQTFNPIWEGMYEGLDFLQLFVADFGGVDRAFGLIVSRVDSSIQLWELTEANQFEGADSRVTWQIEFPAFTWGQEFALKKLVSAELWLDRLYGEVVFKMEWRPDGENCWFTWAEWKECTPRNTGESVPPVTYPLTPFGECYRATKTLPKPPESCPSCSTGRPAYIGYQFQPRLTIKGFCRLRGLLLHSEPVERNLYNKMVC